MKGDLERPLEDFIARTLGPCRLVPAPSRPGQGGVRELVDRDGVRWFLKRLELAPQWAGEVRAYRHWVPALGDHAPTMKACDEGLRAIVLSTAPGRPVTEDDPAAHRRAGQLLRRLHSSRPERPVTDHVHVRARRRLEWELSSGFAGMLSEAEIRFAQDQVERMGGLRFAAQVPCHGDFGPHNWLVDEAGVVRVIDFADSRWHVPGFDFTRLYHRAWWERTDLGDAFFEGYGRQPTSDEQEFVRLHLVINAVTSVRWGHKNHDAELLTLGHDRLGALMAGRWTPTSGVTSLASTQVRRLRLRRRWRG
ncbi:hypothetical protein BH18ACT9_BH18ACT9_05070 [soil metagenome]